MAKRAGVMAVVAASVGFGAVAWAGGDPKVPAGQDPGGIAVALIGGGVDYTAVAIAPRLARDGEGEVIGWDVVDNDRQPFAAGEAPGNATEPAALLLSAYAKGRLVPIRVAPGDAQGLARAIAFAAGTPSRIMAIATPLDTPALRMVVRQASERFRDHLIVVAGDLEATSATSGQPPLPSLGNLGNVLVVSAVGATAGKSVEAVLAATEIVVMPRGSGMFGAIVAGAPPRDQREAVVLAAAAAACQSHNLTQPLMGSAAKAAMLDAARPLAEAPQVRALDPICFYGGVKF